MPLRVGFVTAAHLHGHSYVAAFRNRTDISLAGIWDHNPERGIAFATQYELRTFGRLEELLAESDAVAILSENNRHFDHLIAAMDANLHLICEKPIVTQREHVRVLRDRLATYQPVAMTAFPCPYSPVFHRAHQAVEAGQIGAVKAYCTTNRGSCPFSWFVDPAESGGGAMIDHVVHVADLLLRMHPTPVSRVYSATGHELYRQSWDDSALVTLEFADGSFATIDSSWSRPAGFRTWGDVTLNIVGERGVVEADLFGQEIQRYGKLADGMSHVTLGYGSNIDGALIQNFLGAVLHGERPVATLRDGLNAAEIAIAAYESRASGQPVAV